MTLDKEYFIKALENENNESIINLSMSEIKCQKNNILQKLQLSRDELKNLTKKLKNYRYIDNVQDLNYGNYIRWINLKNISNLNLTNGGFICDIYINDGITVLCRNNFNKIFQLNYDNCLIFQKITNQENIILSVLNEINKK